MLYSEAAIEEYKTLRAEILAHFDRRSSRLAVVWASISALLAAATVANVPELCCIALLLTNSGWVDELRWYDSMIRIASYIRIIIEPQIEGLQWETLLAFALGRLSKKRFGLIYMVFTTYSLFAIACMAVGVILLLVLGPIAMIRQILFFGLLAAGTLFTLRNMREAVNQPQRWQVWGETFMKISEQSRSKEQ
jgi:hypothetical protein